MPDFELALTHDNAGRGARIRTRDALTELGAMHASLCRQIAACLAAARSDGGARESALDRLCACIDVQLRVEAEVLHPALAPFAELAPAVEAARVEHRLMRELADDLAHDDAGALQSRAMLEVLGKLVSHHVEETAHVIAPRLRQSGVDLAELAATLRERRAELEFEHGLDGTSAPAADAPRVSPYDA